MNATPSDDEREPPSTRPGGAGLDGLARAYVRLGLHLGRVVPGLVDAHLGDPRVAEEVAAEPPPDPGELRRDAEALRRRLAEHAGHAERRVEYLDAQLAACAAIAARADGAAPGFVAEVRECLGVEIGPGEPDRYAAAHRALAGLLGVPLRGLPAAMARFRSADRVPPPALRASVAALLGGLREVTATAVGLPDGERVDLEIVRDVPWAGFSRRVAPCRSVMQVAADAGHRWAHLPLLVAHEAYPGHHTEAARTEAARTEAARTEEAGTEEAGTEGRPHPERTLLLARTPQSLVAEGAAELGLEAVVGPGWGGWAAECLAAVPGAPSQDQAAQGEAVETASDPLSAVRQDAALLLHASFAVDRAEQAREHLRRWLFVDDARADRMLAFLAHPRWRIHTTTYVEGTRLVRPWLAARAPGDAVGERFARLLDESWTPGTLARDTSGSMFGAERYPRHADDTPMSPTV